MSNIINIGLAISAMALALNFAAAMISMPRNTETSGNIFGLSLIGGAFIELCVLIMFLVFLLSR